jgi:hypothetical protein
VEQTRSPNSSDSGRKNICISTCELAGYGR